MTFEASRKKQLLVLQPKGKPLYDGDSQSSFGLKMLQSMGWKKGNGLGRNQQGNLDFIQVRYKSNANGLGFDGLKDNQWTQNEANFDSLLKNLNSQSNSNSNSSDETEQKKKAAKSLEEMSKQSRARVHYKKFTRGKDVYKYSEKDLANILGKKSLKAPEQKEEEQVNPVEDDKPDTYKSELIVNTGISIADYFNQKRKEKSENSNGTKHSHKKAQKFIEEDIEVDNVQEVPEITKKCKKKKNKCNDHENGEIAPIGEENHANENSESNKTKKRKNKKADFVEPVVEEEEQEAPPKKKKKSKSKNIEEEEKVLPTEEITEESSEKINKKKRSRKKKVTENPVSSHIAESSKNEQSNKKNSNDVDRPRGANAVYATDVVLIPSHVAQKLGSVLINKFNHSNLGDIIGYGMTDDIEIKVVETKMGEKNAMSNDKYALYNMDRITQKRVNPRKILTKIKKTKKSIQVI